MSLIILLREFLNGSANRMVCSHNTDKQQRSHFQQSLIEGHAQPIYHEPTTSLQQLSFALRIPMQHRLVFPDFPMQKFRIVYFVVLILRIWHSRNELSLVSPPPFLPQQSHRSASDRWHFPWHSALHRRACAPACAR